MCGRYGRDLAWADVYAFMQPLGLNAPAEDPVASFNIAPTQSSWVLVADEVGAFATQMRWGLVPIWSKDTKAAASMINARLESAATKPAFRSAWKARRCLVPASGYYEWRAESGVKQPYWIHDTAGPVLMFAGLWENWKSPAGDTLQTFTIITRAAMDPMNELHDRTPVMLGRAVLRDWLHGDADMASAIADAAQVPALAWHPVSRSVSSPRNDGRELIEAVQLPQTLL